MPKKESPLAATKGHNRNPQKANLLNFSQADAKSQKNLSTGAGQKESAAEVLSEKLDVHREQKGAASEACKKYHLTDVGNAARFAAEHQTVLRYVAVWKKFIYWDGTHWRLDDDGFVCRLARETVKRMYTEASSQENEDKRRKLVSHALHSEAEPRLVAMIRLASTESGIPVRAEDLDKDSFLLNCKNGTIDIRTGALRQHSADYLITRCLDIEFDPDALCPTFVNFVSEIMAGNSALVDFLQRAIGYSLTGSTNEQCFFLLHGPGANGKSTLLETITILLGRYARQIQAETLLTRKTDNCQSNDIAALKGMRFVSCSEVEDGRSLAEAKLKTLTGSDSLSARFLYCEFFEFQPTHKIWMAVNHRPHIKGTDHAIWRRIYLVPFNVVFTKERQDKNLLEKLKAELTGILVWCVRGALAWQRKGLNPPAEVLAAVEEYRSDMDLLGTFMRECCIESSEKQVAAKNLYESYCQWAECVGERTLSQRNMGLKLRELGFKSIHSRSGNVWEGLSLRPGV